MHKHKVGYKVLKSICVEALFYHLQFNVIFLLTHNMVYPSKML